MGKRVTFFIGSLTGGGAERVTCNLANFLSRRGYQIDVLIMSDVEDTYGLDSTINKHILIRRNERKNVFADAFLRYRRLGKYMQTEKVDCYVVMLPITIAMMMMQRQKTKAKVIASERNDPLSYSYFIQKTQKMLAKRADGYVFQTEDAQSWYRECLMNCKTIVIPNAINENFIGKTYAGERRKAIVNVGRLKSQKNTPLLISAFARISKEFPDYVLEIYGAGEKEDEIRRFIQASGLETKVKLMGYVVNVRERIIDAELFVLSSDYEGMPNALMEAMALGLPCISTDCPCGGPHFLIQDGQNGILVPVGNAEKMANAMRDLLNNQEKRKRISENAIEIQHRLAPEKIYGKWEKFINDVCEG